MKEPTIKDYVESAYLHGLGVENLDTGEFEPPRDISDIEWITEALERLIIKEKIDELEKLSWVWVGKEKYINLKEVNKRIGELKKRNLNEYERRDLQSTRPL